MRRVLSWCAACALIALALGLTAAHVTPGPGSGAFMLAAPGGVQAAAFAPSLPEGPVAVNTADADELDTLPGVGEVRTENILNELNIAASRRLRGLGIHQRKALINLLDR